MSRQEPHGADWRLFATSLAQQHCVDRSLSPALQTATGGGQRQRQRLPVASHWPQTQQQHHLAGTSTSHHNSAIGGAPVSPAPSFAKLSAANQTVLDFLCGAMRTSGPAGSAQPTRLRAPPPPPPSDNHRRSSSGSAIRSASASVSATVGVGEAAQMIDGVGHPFAELQRQLSAMAAPLQHLHLSSSQHAANATAPTTPGGEGGGGRSRRCVASPPLMKGGLAGPSHSLHYEAGPDMQALPDDSWRSPAAGVRHHHPHHHPLMGAAAAGSGTASPRVLGGHTPYGCGYGSGRELFAGGTRGGDAQGEEHRAGRQPSVDVSPPSERRLSPAARRSVEQPADDQRAVQRLYSLSDLTVAEAMAARAASVSAAHAGRGGSSGGSSSKVNDAVVSRLLGLEDAVAAQMLRHVRGRGQLATDTERAKHDTESMDFLLLELQTHNEVTQRALAERIASRVATLRQLREDAALQTRAAMLAELRALPAAHRPELSDGALLSRMSVLRTMLSQLETHQQVQLASLEHSAQQALAALRERFVALHHVLDSGVLLPGRGPPSQQQGGGEGSPSRRVDGVASMLEMVGRFAAETRAHLASLRKDRVAFEENFIGRLAQLHP